METPPEYRTAAPAAGDAAGLSAAERGQALRDDVRRKYREANPRHLMAGNWFRLEEVLDEADALAQQVAALKAELAEQETQLLRRDEERRKLHRAILVASSGRLSAAEREAYATNTNGQGTRGAYGAGEIMGRVSLAQDLLALLAAPQQQEGGQPIG